jgi:DNA-binding GntR family transcriptional regulator
MADHLAARIAAGDLTAGSRLPNERELSREYGVALGTARRAVQELRDRGLVTTLASKGTFVLAAPEDPR